MVSKPDFTMVHRWTAKRSSARMTIKGFTPSNEEVKFGVDEIAAPTGPGAFVTATDKKTGKVYALA